MADSNNKLVVLYEGLNTALANQVTALPKGFNQSRFVQNCMTVVQEGNFDMTKIDVSSLKRTLMKGAFLGLDFFNKECYAIVYGNSVNFQTDYKGETKLAKKYSAREILDIYAKLVKEGDTFEETIIDGKQTVDFKPLPFNNGPVIGAFAVVLYKDGGMMYETMSRQEIEDTRTHYSKAPNSPAWKNSWGEMAKKTVLRRLCKHIDLDFETTEMAKTFDEAGDCTFDTEIRVENEINANANTTDFPEDTPVEKVSGEVE